jgi:nitrile hydratase beta subunit
VRYGPRTDGIHDMGGMHGFGPVVTPGSEQAYDEPWEGRIFAITQLAAVERLARGSGRAIREEMAPEEYLRASYYERWLWSTERRLERSGTLAPGELDERMRSGAPATPRPAPEEQAERAVATMRETQSLTPAGPARFAVGERVRVRRMRPEGHTRCPRYVRGATGTVEAVRGNDPLPDIGPYKGPSQPVYAVAFDSEELFGPSEDGRWTVLLDLFEDYLESP